MSDLSTLQTLVNSANVGVIISLALSFVFGAASILLANKLGTLKDAQAETAQRNLELAVATQRERAANAEKALVEVQERIKPRRPTREQIDALALRLHNNPIKGKVDMLFQQGDPEAYNFALELLQVLRENDWGPFDSMNPEPTPNAYGEIHMYCPDRSAPECQVLGEALRGVGLPVSGGHDPKLPSGKILIIKINSQSQIRTLPSSSFSLTYSLKAELKTLPPNEQKTFGRRDRPRDASASRSGARVHRPLLRSSA